MPVGKLNKIFIKIGNFHGLIKMIEFFENGPTVSVTEWTRLIFIRERVKEYPHDTLTIPKIPNLSAHNSLESHTVRYGMRVLSFN